MNTTASFVSHFNIISLVYLASPYIFLILAFWIFKEHATYLKKKSFLPGPSFFIPVVGSAIQLLRDPTSYWTNQSSYAKKTPEGISANYILGRFMVFIQSSEVSHRVLNNVRPEAFRIVLHPFGKKLFGENHVVHKMGQKHKDLRRRMIPYFTPQALAIYSESQQTIMRNHILTWVRLSNSTNKPIVLKNLVRKMNLEISQTTFIGPYLNELTKDELIKDYDDITVGWMSLPFNLPGFAFRSASRAIGRHLKTLSACAAKSRTRMVSGNHQPTCLIYFMMMQQVNDEEMEKIYGEVSAHFFSFLFAAQDASTSPLLWAVTFLESNPHVLAKVREEVASIWSPKSGDLIISPDQLAAMEYTNAVALEILRHRPPVTLLPHVAIQDFQLTKNYTVPKGTIVFPSIFQSSFQGFSDPDRFNPDRFMKGREEDVVYRRNYLVFGSGAHQCVAQKSATKAVVLFIAMFTSMVDFKRHTTHDCDDVVYGPTIYPKDDCTVYLFSRG